MEKDGPLDGRKYNENKKDRQIGQVTPKKIFFIPQLLGAYLGDLH